MQCTPPANRHYSCVLSVRKTTPDTNVLAATSFLFSAGSGTKERPEVKAGNISASTVEQVHITTVVPRIIDHTACLIMALPWHTAKERPKPRKKKKKHFAHACRDASKKTPAKINTWRFPDQKAPHGLQEDRPLVVHVLSVCKHAAHPATISSQCISPPAQIALRSSQPPTAVERYLDTRSSDVWDASCAFVSCQESPLS